MIRWGIIGGGNIAHRFAESLKHFEGGELAAVSCRTQEKAEAFSREYPCRYIYDDYDRLLENEEIDAVYIGLPHDLHCQWAVRAMEAGKAVLCEKPAALNAEEMKEICRISKERKILFMEAMKTRFVPIHRLIMTALEQGLIGRITKVEASLCNLSAQRAPDCYLYDSQQGGVLLDVGIYCASWIDELTRDGYGMPEIRQTAFRMKDQVESYAKCWLLYRDDAGDRQIRAMLECAFDEKKPRKLTIFGEWGTIEVPELHRPQKMAVTEILCEESREGQAGLDALKVEWGGTCIPAEDGRKKTFIFEVPYEVDDFYGQIIHFTRCLNEGLWESPVMPPEASQRCIELIEMIRDRRPDNSYHGISIQYDDRIVRVRTDRYLFDFLSRPGNDSLELADYIHKTYKEKWNKELKISRESLSVEILIHAYMDTVFRRMDVIVDKIGGPGRQLKKTLEFLEDSTEIIDCGEREVDSNRVVFDNLVPFRKILYKILGDKA